MRNWFVFPLLVPLVLNAQSWKPPLTIDGQPDLQGTWNYGSNVPLERPDNLGAKEFYTPQEAAENRKKGFQGDRAVTGGAHYDLAQFGLDPSQARYAPNLRTSMIVGPEGKIPDEIPQRCAVTKPMPPGKKVTNSTALRTVLWASAVSCSPPWVRLCFPSPTTTTCRFSSLPDT